ncbi:AMP-binding protein [Streptomyces sp. NPDC056503]|uniref:AMP-binding protein n=1 Tax=Streptomyces sp. NPDC056503 TaxID=3345842 RepID=UPI00367D1AFA
MVARAQPPALPPWSADPAVAAGPPPALGDLLTAPARKWPDRTAIDDGAVTHTFAELEQGALAVAGWLAAQGVGAGDRVVVLAEKRAVMPMIILGVWKRGAVHVPLDATEPEARLRGLLARLRPAAVIALGDRRPPAPGTPLLGGERLAEVLAGPAAPHPTVAHGPEDVAYVVFASGATGEPQGAEITVDGLYAHFTGHNEVLRCTPDSRVLSLSPFHFDVSLLDTLLPLSVGAYVHQFRGLPAGAVIRSVLARRRVTHLLAVTVMLGLVTGDGRQITRAKLPDLELVMTGAQVCHPDVLRAWTDGLPETRVVQAFGPPEATIFAFTHTVGPEDTARTTPCPVGGPLGGVRARLVRDGAEVHGTDAEGELWIGGPQVMRGYFDQPEETARLVVEADGTRWFRTGDVCVRDAAGALVLRRHDDERITWLAGRRTHLDEITRAALGCPGVDRAVAAPVRRDGRDTVALAVASKDRRTLAEVTEHLRGLLPEPLRPALLAWTPAEPAPEPGDDGAARELAGRLAQAARTSHSPYVALSADGAVEPIDEVEICP